MPFLWERTFAFATEHAVQMTESYPVPSVVICAKSTSLGQLVVGSRLPVGACTAHSEPNSFSPATGFSTSK